MSSEDPVAPQPFLIPPAEPRRRAVGRWTAHRAPSELAKASLLVPEVLTRLGRTDERAYDWVPSGAAWTSTGTAVFRLGPPRAAPVALLRLSPTGEQRLLRESAVLAELGELVSRPDAAAMLPRRLGTGKVEGCAYVVDVLLPGSPAEAVVGTPRWAALETAALGAIGEVHRLTAGTALCDEALLRRWVDEPLAVIGSVLDRHPRLTGVRRSRELREELREALLGRPVRPCWIHGDFWPGNLLSVGGELTGIVDWDLASPGELPHHDYLHLLLYRRRLASGSETGDIVTALLKGRDGLTPVEEVALEGASWSFPDGAPPLRVLLLLQWLRHVAAVSIQQRSYVTHSVRVWELRNVHQVLRAV